MVNCRCIPVIIIAEKTGILSDIEMKVIPGRIF